MCFIYFFSVRNDYEKPFSAVYSPEEHLVTLSKTAAVTGISEFDCFLAHEWGCHERVKQVRDMLEQRGFNVWLDEAQLNDDLVAGITQGVDQSRKIIVFLTMEYMNRAHNPNFNCTKELNYVCLKKDLKNIIVVVFENTKELLNPKEWVGKVAFELGQKVYIDLSTAGKMQKNFTKLCAAVKEK